VNVRARALAIAAVGLAACSSPTDSGTTSSAERHMREIEQRVKDSLPKTEEIALAQMVEPDVVKKVQAELRTLEEYLDDPPSGKIDMVTVNAIEAFQRRAGLRDDGLLDTETLKRLEATTKEPPAIPAGDDAARYPARPS
jgi:peptidoglycan hydrolase-like protein with peptidoglycan-binding domain